MIVIVIVIVFFVQGVVGLATNPVVGILDAVAHTGDSCRDVLNLMIKEPAQPVQRVRMSELFGPDGRILPYSFSIALGTQILQVLDRVSGLIVFVAVNLVAVVVFFFVAVLSKNDSLSDNCINIFFFSF
jgi:hypothetical protein